MRTLLGRRLHAFDAVVFQLVREPLSDGTQIDVEKRFVVSRLAKGSRSGRLHFVGDSQKGPPFGTFKIQRCSPGRRVEFGIFKKKTNYSPEKPSHTFDPTFGFKFDTLIADRFRLNGQRRSVAHDFLLQLKFNDLKSTQPVPMALL